MKFVALKDFDKVWEIFKIYKKEYLPHIRTDYVKRQIKKKSIILEKNVVINFDVYKRNVKLGNKLFQKGTTIIHQIANKNQRNGNAKIVLKKFLKEMNKPIILSVRNDNKIAVKFYLKNKFKKVGKINWINNKIKGSIYEFK